MSLMVASIRGETNDCHSISGYDAQASNQIELVAKIAQGLRAGEYSNGIAAKKIVLAGDSFGSIISFGVIKKYPDIAEGKLHNPQVVPFPVPCLRSNVTAIVLTGAALPTKMRQTSSAVSTQHSRTACSLLR